ncbi:DUF2007 domain-containing protein [Hymenobacter sp. BT175]|uniref:putative signal transducing protein n=1 Tax=Hymenobacter translucens TaxID=2886507 RepID=UPI001D0E6116|nr:DUF2007 domain-containing protein [Hymenobacter translucens]MCC2545553.1 DUF2007 domain-containing protein [Hymenobacter translucens]
MSSVPPTDAIVVVDSFANYVAAHLAKSRLDAENIPCFLTGENRPYGPITGGIRLHVRQPDLSRAQEVLRYQTVPMAVSGPDDAPDRRQCPRCGSADVSQGPDETETHFLPRLLNLLFLRPLRPYHCFHCGHDFREDESKEG